METELRDALAARLAHYETLTEVGVGRQPTVAAALAAAGKRVVVTDVHEFEVPPELRFVRDDVVTASERPDPGPAYRSAAVYALNLPPELHRPTRDVAAAVGADFLFTTLGYETPDVPCETETLAGGRETLYVVSRDRRPKGQR
ncbi:UPF0146 family protein [Halogeometricum limi]|uniref:UPF0146 protein SAMN04488124_0570 n=1 Tax=Halogeometricum limi TaxID=555875 RepID=A0A1I6FYW1_9EURY|nr:UPF0146 family protein [Halogeometricum limi]SFR35133.1 hypothetical protein SAMN04488124_0570 [Halogeometricum limi]